MARSSSASSRSAASRALPDRIPVLLYEARWLGLAVAALVLALALVAYSPADPGWSHSVPEGYATRNLLGTVGAYLADIMVSLFGRSAWWWVVFLGYGLGWSLRREWKENNHAISRRSLAWIVGGFVLVLLAGCGLEHLRFHSHGTQLPNQAGGVLGAGIAGLTQSTLGFTGGTLLLVAALVAGVSMLCRFSWLNVAERTGTLLEDFWRTLRRVVVRVLEGWLDRRRGQVVAREREEKVQSRRLKELAEPTVPRHIEPSIQKVAKSERVEAERQQTMFAEFGEAELPPLSLLDPPPTDNEPPSPETLEYTSRLIETKLGEFGVQVRVAAAYPGPVVTRYEIEPATGVKGSQVVNLAKDLARSLSLVSIRVVETVPGKSCMALELPNVKRQVVRLSEILGSKVYNDMASPLTVALGKDIGGQPVVADLAKMPHLLVAGTTGSGKSVGINAMILSLLYKSEPSRVRLIMVDPKMLELSIYEGIPHLLAPVVTDMKHAANALDWCVGEMDKRYRLMAAVGVRNLAGFNKHILEGHKHGTPVTNPFSISPENPEPLECLPHIVVIIDELADMMMVVGKKVEELIARLAQKARAAGIHLIIATQRPSVDVITGLIKANVPTRIAFQVSSKIDSRTILDQMGAETLLGMGDMLYLAPGTGLPLRVHGAFVADEEVHKVVEHLKRMGPPDYVEGILNPPEDADAFAGAGGGGAEGGEADPMYDQAVAIVLKTRRPSISLVQRHLRIGYNRAARLIEQMEHAGLVSAPGHNGNREVLAPNHTEEDA